jgi:hypothetical protein
MIARGLRIGEERAVERIFLDTIASGRPLPFSGPEVDEYTDLCLGWYLGPGRDDVLVLDHLGSAVGYALVCTDDRAHRRWARPVATTWTVRAARGILTGRFDEASARFHRLRLRDGWATMLGPPPPYNAHLHLNVADGHRGGAAGRLLIDAAEERFRAAGVRWWYGEINAPVGRRGAALERRGARIVHRQPNLTLSWLADRPIERLRFTREVPPAPQSQPERRKARYSSPEAVPITVSTNGYPKDQRSSGKVSKFIP